MEFTAEMIAGLLGGSIVGDKSAAVHTVSSIEGGKKGERRVVIKPVRSTKVGRNDPCPCGSGKKYKNCCGDPAKKNNV